MLHIELCRRSELKLASSVIIINNSTMKLLKRGSLRRRRGGGRLAESDPEIRSIGNYLTTQLLYMK